MLEKMSSLLSTLLLLSPLFSLIICSTIGTIKSSSRNQNHSTTSTNISLANFSDTEYFYGQIEEVTDEPVHENLSEQIIDTTSIGIRSFTVEITKEEKRQSSTSAPNKTEKRASNIPPLEDFSADMNNKTFSTSEFMKNNTTDSSISTKTKEQPKIQVTTISSILSHSTQLPHENIVGKSDLKISFKSDDNQAENGSHENEVFNAVKKLYRTKIGEITTGDYNLEINVKESQDQQHVNRDRLPSDIPVHHGQLKVNIDDFFPSNIEDFKPIIEISNQKILREKNILHNEKIKPKLNNNVDGVKSGTRINTSNAATTTNIEVELIEDTSNPNVNDNSKNIQIDEVITHMEDMVTDNSFIPRRVKKLNPTLKTNGKGSTKVQNFSMTKFSTDKPRKFEKNQVIGNSEFSTTKFYNSNLLKKDALQIKNKTVLPTQTMVTNLFKTIPTTIRPHVLSRFQDKLNMLDCDLQNLLTEMTVWRGNETHELNLPMTTPEECSSESDCLPMILSWEASAEIQSGDVLIVEIDDKLLVPTRKNNKTDIGAIHRNSAAVYQVTRLGHEHCDITEGELLDITPLVVDGRKLVTLYDKDLTEGINLLIVVSELWDQQCVRLRVNVKSDNCGENAECSGKGICFSNNSMEGYECECCIGFSGPHCEEIDACTPSPCTNNGICVDLSQGHEGNSYQCLCPYGYTGKNCETETDPCSPSQCLNGGTCVTNATHFRIANSTFPFRCECPQGFTGPLCQHNLNECESSPCIHGICVDQEDGFRCFCQPGFSGDLCNFEYNECDSNPCVNGLCIDHIGTYSCQCSKGYQGKRCHIKIDFCANNPCEDGYRCVDHGNEYSCVCPGSGDHNVPCDEVPRTLCTTNPCANGGTCWTSDESFYCACRPGFIGKMCEDDFVVDTVVSSSELLSDISDSNVITFDDPHESLQLDTSLELGHIYAAAGILAISLLALAFLVTVLHCKLNESWRNINYRQLIPFFNRDRTYVKQNPHWLSGKGSSFFEENQINLKNNRQFHQGSNSSIFNGPLQLNLENDMYFTVDFSESQQSLIQ